MSLRRAGEPRVSLLRRAILAAAESERLREIAPRYGFVRRAMARFMPGERAEDAIAAAARLREKGIGAALSHLGESVRERAEAEAIAREYLALIERIREAGLPCELSLKLTQLGFDLDAAFCAENFSRLAERMPAGQAIWIDMESSAYADPTLEFYRGMRRKFPATGVCVQAYLYRTEMDLEAIVAENAAGSGGNSGVAVRLVKGAYNEPSEIAFARKDDVDENYFELAKKLLSREAGPGAPERRVRAIFGTHDRALMRRICEWAQDEHIPRGQIEFQMLYGIQRAEQERLAREGYRSSVLISYGTHWFPWYMRRLAERPANLLFLLRNLASPD